MSHMVSCKVIFNDLDEYLEKYSNSSYVTSSGLFSYKHKVAMFPMRRMRKPYFTFYYGYIELDTLYYYPAICPEKALYPHLDLHKVVYDKDAIFRIYNVLNYNDANESPSIISGEDARSTVVDRLDESINTINTVATAISSYNTSVPNCKQMLEKLRFPKSKLRREEFTFNLLAQYIRAQFPSGPYTTLPATGFADADNLMFSLSFLLDHAQLQFYRRRITEFLSSGSVKTKQDCIAGINRIISGAVNTSDVPTSFTANDMIRDPENIKLGCGVDRLADTMRVSHFALDRAFDLFCAAGKAVWE